MEKSKQIVVKNNDAAILPAPLSSGFIPAVAVKLGYDETELTKRAVEFYNFCRVKDLSAKTGNKLMDCTPESTQKAFLQVAAWNIPLDSRDFCYFYNNNGNMTAEPSYKGLLYVASQNGLEVDAGLVFDGDSFEMTESAAGDSFVLKRGNPFGRKKIVGFYAFVKCARYSPKIYTFSFEELEAAKQASVRKMFGKESPAWKYFPNDMYLKVGLKKALKISMAKIEIRSEIRAMFDDEVPEAESAVQMQSEKTALFAPTTPVEALTATPVPETPSIETDGQENGQGVDISDEEIEMSEENAEPPAVILELSAFLEKLETYTDESLSLDDADTLKKMKYVNDLRDRLETAGYADASKQAADAFNKKLRKGVK